MICETCDKEFQDSAVKIYKGKKVCPSCFDVLNMTDVLPENKTVQIVQNSSRETTVCPECNAEIHKDSVKCPMCGAYVQRTDRIINKTIDGVNSGASSLKQSVNKNSKKIKKWFFQIINIGGVLGVILGITVMIFWYNQEFSPPTAEQLASSYAFDPIFRPPTTEERRDWFNRDKKEGLLVGFVFLSGGGILIIFAQIMLYKLKE